MHSIAKNSWKKCELNEAKINQVNIAKGNVNLKRYLV